MQYCTIITDGNGTVSVAYHATTTDAEAHIIKQRKAIATANATYTIAQILFSIGE